MGRKITQEKIKEINEIYFITGTYSGTAQKAGVSPSTVKKYIIPNYIPENKIKSNQVLFNKEIKNLDKDLFLKDEYWGNLCVMTEKEFEEIKELWKEIIV